MSGMVTVHKCEIMKEGIHLIKLNEELTSCTMDNPRKFQLQRIVLAEREEERGGTLQEADTMELAGSSNPEIRLTWGS